MIEATLPVVLNNTDGKEVAHVHQTAPGNFVERL